MFISKGKSSGSSLLSFAEDIYFRIQNLKMKGCDLKVDQHTLEQLKNKLDFDFNLNLKQPLKKNKFVVFDLETTGLKPFAGDEIISVGAVVVEDAKVKIEDSFHSYVEPQRSIPQKITDLTGITEQMVEGSPDILTVLNEFLDFVDGRSLIAHHASFDTSFINLKLQRYCRGKLNLAVLDTCELAKITYPYLECYSLDHLASVCEVPIKGRHTALDDSIMTAHIYLNLLNNLNQKGILTIEDLFNFWKRNSWCEQQAQGVIG